jgi:hypothetical protein
LLKNLGEDPGRFDAQHLRQFILDTSQRCGWASAKKCTTAVRMFLRFLIADGKCAASRRMVGERRKGVQRALKPPNDESALATIGWKWRLWAGRLAWSACRESENSFRLPETVSQKDRLKGEWLQF